MVFAHGKERLGSTYLRTGQLAFAQQLAGAEGTGGEDGVVDNRIGDVVAGDGIEHGRGFFQRSGHRFFADDGQARLGRGDYLLGVQVVRRGDDDGVERSLGQHFAVLAIALFLWYRSSGADCGAIFVQRVGKSGDLYGVEFEQRWQVLLLDDTTAADEAESYGGWHESSLRLCRMLELVVWTDPLNPLSARRRIA